ncbi:hypothetical protein FF1_042852 [Malus domestica]
MADTIVTTTINGAPFTIPRSHVDGWVPHSTTYVTSALASDEHVDPHYSPGSCRSHNSVGPGHQSQQSPQSPCLKESKRRRHVSARERHDDEKSVVWLP